MPHSTRLAATLLEAAAACPSFRPCALLEIAAFSFSEKPSLRFVVAPDEETHFRSAADSLGLKWASAPVYLEPEGHNWFSIVSRRTNNRRSLVVVTHDVSPSSLLDAETRDSDLAGSYLGYPPCCVRAFARLTASPGKWAQVLADTARDKSSIDARCNRFAAEWGGIGLLGELFPCSLECNEARGYADRLYMATRRLGLHRLADKARQDSLLPVSISESGEILTPALPGADTLSFIWNQSSH